MFVISVFLILKLYSCIHNDELPIVQKKTVIIIILQWFKVADGDVAILVFHGCLCPAVLSLVHDPDQVPLLAVEVVTGLAGVVVEGSHESALGLLAAAPASTGNIWAAGLSEQ